MIAETNPVIRIKNVSKSFKTVRAVNNISIDIHEGQFVALLGPNGAGKTTLVEMIEGIQKPDDGEIWIEEKHWKNHAEELHRIIGLSLQETRYIDKLNVNETLKLFAGFYELGQERVDEIIRLVGLEDKKKSYVVNLSGGQRQRLALGIALLNNPKILILDEPTTGLDPNARREVWSILHKLKKEAHTSMILTTHYMEEAEQLCDYIIIIDKGIILKEGTIDQLLDEENDSKIVDFSIEELKSAKSIFNNQSSFSIHLDMDRGKGWLYLNEIEKELPAFLEFLKKNDLHLKNMECRRKTLDDLFVTMTGRRLDE
ncbi:MAG: ABC transporter ATP-binding protein [Calditrichaceae bacterium]|nr:ABC transporter ATP-binding protein [Calditrichaceae bacterium]